MNVEFECVICGETATATVSEDATESSQEPLRTLRDCPDCGIETIRVER